MSTTESLDTAAATTAFIGLGAMGQGMALNLLSSLQAGLPHFGQRLLVLDRDSQRMQPLLQAGAVAADGLEDIATRCDTVFLCLPESAPVQQVLFGGANADAAGGLAQQAQRAGRSQTYIDTTTLERQRAIGFAAQAAGLGHQYCDCPVSGLPARADTGTLTVMFGGEKSLFEHSLPALSAFGDTVLHCGEVGAGQAMKAINNVIYDVNIAALCEMLPLAVSAGLDPELVASVVTTGSAHSFAAEHFVPRMLERRFDGDFAIADAYKDIVNVQHLATESAAMLPVVNAMIASYQAAIAEGHGRQAKSVMLRRFEDALGVTFEAGR